jgi:hypothetical protein
MTGQIIGTANYMSPEQARGLADVDSRSDLYSLGVMAYEMVAGRRPFEADSPVEALTKRLTQDPPPLRSVAKDAPDDLVTAISRCLEREPAKRWPGARALRIALATPDEYMEDPIPVRLLKVGVIIATLVFYASIYLAIFRGPAAAIGTIIGMGVPALFVIAVASVMVKRQQIARRSLLHLALIQPRWWRGWYPKPFRRRGDVWDRLPLPIRRMRVQMVFGFVMFAFVLLPTQIGLVVTHGLPTVKLVLELLMFGWVAFVISVRTRATKYVAKTLGVTPVEASQILSAKSWQTSAWQSGPASELLRVGAATSVRPRPSPSHDAPTVLASAHADPTKKVTPL